MEGGNDSTHGNIAGIADAGSDVEGGCDMVNVTPVDRRLLCLKCGHLFPVKEAYLGHINSKSCAGGQVGTEPAGQEETGETPPPPPPQPKPAPLVVEARNFFHDPLELTLGLGPRAPLPPPLGSTNCRVWGKELGQAVEGGTVAAAPAAAAEVGSAAEEDGVDLVLRL